MYISHSSTVELIHRSHLLQARGISFQIRSTVLVSRRVEGVLEVQDLSKVTMRNSRVFLKSPDRLVYNSV